MGITPRSLYRWLQNAKTTDGLAAKPHPEVDPKNWTVE